MLEVRELSFTVENSHGPVEILHGIDLALEDGRFYAITGPNGGGKSTLARVIMGIAAPSAGRILWDGEDVTADTVTDRARRGIRYAFQAPPRFKGMTVRKLLSLAAGSADEQLMRRSLRQVGLCPNDYLDRPVDAGLSGGEAKRLEVAGLLATKARFLIFDEPEAGVDLWTFERLVHVLREGHTAVPGRTTVVISHNIKLLGLADELIVLADGAIQERGSREEMLPLIQDEVACRWQRRCIEDDGLECL
ncbi:MAG TPA: ATP-binding cassette domain-containing protein [Firmicutes bacterium]|nr:ATP-binding cassette domain-containing protein [Bacillota bacterium]